MLYIEEIISSFSPEIFSTPQHRKEKGSQDLDFLEKVDDEKSKGEFYINNK